MNSVQEDAYIVTTEEISIPICKIHVVFGSHEGTPSHALCSVTSGKPFLLFVNSGDTQVFVVCKGRGFSWFKFKEIQRQYTLYFLDSETYIDRTKGAMVVSAKELDDLVAKYFLTNTTTLVIPRPALGLNKSLKIFSKVPDRVAELATH